MIAVLLLLLWYALVGVLYLVSLACAAYLAAFAAAIGWDVAQHWLGNCDCDEPEKKPGEITDPAVIDAMQKAHQLHAAHLL